MPISRREFMTAAGAGLSLDVGPVEGIAPAASSGRANAQGTLWIDGLCGMRLGEEGFDEVRRSRLTMLETTIGTGRGRFHYDDAIHDLAEWQGHFDRYADRILRVRTSADLLEARRTGRLAVMIGFQNATQLDRNIDNVAFFYHLGIRQIQLTYNDLNALGAGCTERHDVGLSDFGVAVVHKMNELGMLVDVSHTGYRTTMDAIEMSNAPVLFSHTNCRALCDNPRCKTDEQIKKLAARGGVMGVTTVNFFVSKKPRSTLDDLVDHIVHVADLVGIDHVGIGSDSAIGGWRLRFPTETAFRDYYSSFQYKPGIDLRWPPFIEEIDSPERYSIIAEQLERRGFSDQDRQKVMGGNLYRVYRTVLG